MTARRVDKERKKEEEEEEEERKICGFSDMRPCAFKHIWRHLIDYMESVWPVDCMNFTI